MSSRGESLRPRVRFGLRYVAEADEAVDVQLRNLGCAVRLARTINAEIVFFEGTREVDPFVVLGASAMEHDAIALGCVVGPTDRPAAILAKTVTALDLVSRGRAVLAIAPCEHVNIGQQCCLDQRDLGEMVEICRAMLRVEAPSMRGSVVTLARAWNEPRLTDLGALPIAFIIPHRAIRDRDRSQFEELIDIAMRFADLCVLEVGNLNPGSLANVASTSVSPIGDLPSRGMTLSLVGELETARTKAGRLPGEVGLLVALEARRTDGSIEVEETVALAASWRESGISGILLDVASRDCAEAPTLTGLASIALIGRPGSESS